jgi:aspartate aminotransferase
VSGKEKLREAICEYTRRQDAVSYQPRQVCVTCGAKDAIHLTLAALIDPGDEVIVPVPYWVSYPEQARLVGGTPVFVPGDKSRGGKIDPERLRAAITPRTRVFILNTPSNPAGFAYSHSEVEAIADVLRPTAVLIISDEIYNRLYFRDEPPLSFAALPGMYDRTITINGASKAFAMTGWRLGYAAGPEPIIAAAARIQSQTTNGPASFVQSAMIAALTGDQACVDRMRCTYRRRAEVMYAALNRLESVHCVEPGRVGHVRTTGRPRRGRVLCGGPGARAHRPSAGQRLRLGHARTVQLCDGGQGDRRGAAAILGVADRSDKEPGALTGGRRRSLGESRIAARDPSHLWSMSVQRRSVV